jgi:hypothetical protein
VPAPGVEALSRRARSGLTATVGHHAASCVPDAGDLERTAWLARTLVSRPRARPRGRSALNPSAGPAAIGGMLVPGEEPEVEPTESMKMQKRLSSAVSDITKLANAQWKPSPSRCLTGALHVGERRPSRRDERAQRARSGCHAIRTATAARCLARTVGGGVGESRHPHSLTLPRSARPTSDTQRQAASHYRT